MEDTSVSLGSLKLDEEDRRSGEKMHNFENVHRFVAECSSVYTRGKAVWRFNGVTSAAKCTAEILVALRCILCRERSLAIYDLSCFCWWL